MQDFSSFFWSEDEINARLVRIMQEAFAGIWQVAQEHKVSLRTATFIVACQRSCTPAKCAACIHEACPGLIFAALAHRQRHEPRCATSARQSRPTTGRFLCPWHGRTKVDCYGFGFSRITGREAADSAVARQGEPTT